MSYVVPNWEQFVNIKDSWQTGFLEYIRIIVSWNVPIAAPENLLCIAVDNNAPHQMHYTFLVRFNEFLFEALLGYVSPEAGLKPSGWSLVGFLLPKIPGNAYYWSATSFTHLIQNSPPMLAVIAQQEHSELAESKTPRKSRRSRTSLRTLRNDTTPCGIK